MRRAEKNFRLGCILAVKVVLHDWVIAFNISIGKKYPEQ